MKGLQAGRTPRHAVRWAAGLGMVLCAALVPWSPAHAIDNHTPATPFTGWAMDAYPGDSVATLKTEMARQVAAGANVVWLGHNNPADVGLTKGEPALSFAVWSAYSDRHSPLHAAAAAMVRAQMNALAAAKALGVQVVLPIGYQIQMGLCLEHRASRRSATRR